jgi:hypothetical protein
MTHSLAAHAENLPLPPPLLQVFCLFAGEQGESQALQSPEGRPRHQIHLISDDAQQIVSEGVP